MDLTIKNDWAEKLQGELNEPYMQELLQMLEQKYEHSTVYPARENLLNALNYTSFEGTKIVILGQDPYHGEGQAHGLSFSVLPGVKTPPSLKNIYKEVQADIGCSVPKHGCLESWARQGVLLLNTVLTVEAGNPNSHKGLGWEKFTDRIINVLNDREQPVVFLLWGNYAQAKASCIDENKHHVIRSAHPSPLAARKGFYGSKPFSRANAFLASKGSAQIDWELPELVLNTSS